eukprot:COSAG05_NODE_568_length_8638_cov_8.593395_5_plen_68_part_00
MKFDFFTGKLAIAYDMDLDDATISKLVSLAIEASAKAAKAKKPTEIGTKMTEVLPAPYFTASGSVAL